MATDGIPQNASVNGAGVASLHPNAQYDRDHPQKSGMMYEEGTKVKLTHVKCNKTYTVKKVLFYEGRYIYKLNPLREGHPWTSEFNLERVIL